MNCSYCYNTPCNPCDIYCPNGGPPQTQGIGYKPPQTPGIAFGPPQTPGIGYKPPQTPGIAFGPPQTQGIGYKPPQTPGIAFGPPQTPGIGYKPPQTPGIGFGPPKSMLGGLQVLGQPVAPKPKPSHYSDDTTEPPWWLTMSSVEANAVITKAVQETKDKLAATSTAESEAAKAAKAEKAEKAKKEVEAKSAKAAEEAIQRASKRDPLDCLYFAMMVNEEAAAQVAQAVQSGCEWIGWRAKPRETRPPIGLAQLPPLTLSSYEQFRASRGHPMVFNEQTKRFVMLLPGTQPVGNVTIMSQTGEMITMDTVAFEKWKKTTATTTVSPATTTEVGATDDTFDLVRTFSVVQ